MHSKLKGLSRGGRFAPQAKNFGNLERVVSWGSKSGRVSWGHFAPQAKNFGKIKRAVSWGGGHFGLWDKRAVSWGSF